MGSINTCSMVIVLANLILGIVTADTNDTGMDGWNLHLRLLDCFLNLFLQLVSIDRLRFSRLGRIDCNSLDSRTNSSLNSLKGIFLLLLNATDSLNT